MRDNELLDLQHNADVLRKKEEEKRERQYEKLWREIKLPCTFEELLSRLTKDDLHDIRRNLGLKSLSALKKTDMIKAMAGQIPAKAKKLFFLFDLERYRLVREAVEKDGIVWKPSFSYEKIRYLMLRGVMFPGRIDGRMALFMPEELRAVFREIDGPALMETVQRNDECIRLTHGMLYYYGVVEIFQQYEMISNFTGQPLDDIHYILMMAEAIDYYRRIRIGSSFTFCDTRLSFLFDEESILQEQKACEEIGYYPFSREQLLQAGTEGYVEITPEMNRLVGHLMHYYGFSKKRALEIAKDCFDLVQQGIMPGQLVRYLEAEIEVFASTKAVDEMLQILIDLSNNTRLWTLKGYTLNEMSILEKKGNNVIQLGSRSKKVGRNDPCPCGSGKKYKKCCGSPTRQ